MCWRKAGEKTEDIQKIKIINEFYIPTEGNSITSNDIQRSLIRITKENKKYFPDHDCNVKVVIGERTFNVEYKLRNNEDKVRSHLLKLGKEAMDALKLKHGDNLFFQQDEESSYIIRDC